jgi:predicted RNA binding protein YcfA (HicA-like mRNA interferase family)
LEKVSKLPRISGGEVIKILTKVGFIPARQKGSHVILKTGPEIGTKTTVVPLHREIDRGTLLEIIRQAGITKEEFMALV